MSYCGEYVPSIMNFCPLLKKQLELIPDELRNSPQLEGFLKGINEIYERVETQKQFYENLTNFSHAFIITHDKNGVILSANPSICRTLGYESSELVGRSLSFFIPEADVTKL